MMKKSAPKLTPTAMSTSLAFLFLVTSSASAAFQNSPISPGGTGWIVPMVQSSSSYPRKRTNYPQNIRRILDRRGRQRQNILVSDLFIDEFLVHSEQVATGGGRPSSVDQLLHVLHEEHDDNIMRISVPTEERQRQRQRQQGRQQQSRAPFLTQDQKQEQNKKPNTAAAAAPAATETPKGGLCTTVGGRLVRDFGITNPMDRMAITSSGTLQKLISAYYDSTVSVAVEYNQEQEDNPGCWDRLVHMSVLEDQIKFCSATSKVRVLDKECNDMLKSGKIGLGQLFHHYGVQPTFRLLDAGYRENDGGLWRVYELSCDNLIVCRIREDFVPGLWALS